MRHYRRAPSSLNHSQRVIVDKGSFSAAHVSLEMIACYDLCGKMPESEHRCYVSDVVM